MVAGLIRLGAYGREDVFLTYKPTITFFKAVYHRHTSFSIESVEYTIHYSALQFGTRVTHTPFYWGDMLSGVILKISLPPIPPSKTATGLPVLYNWVERVGLAIVKTADVLIGNRVVQRLDQEWLETWYHLSSGYRRAPLEKGGDTKKGMDIFLGSLPSLTQPQESLPAYTLYIPIPFWFTTTPGQALPLTSLNLGEVRLRVELASLDSCLQYGPTHSMRVSSPPTGFRPHSPIFQLGTNTESTALYYGYDPVAGAVLYTPLDPRPFTSPPSNSDAAATQQFRESFFRYPLSVLNQASTTGTVGGLIWDTSGNFCAPAPGASPAKTGAALPALVPLKGSFILLDYILLDERERLFFYNRPQDYTVEQIQKIAVPVLQPGLTRISLGFYNPVMELVWGLKPQAAALSQSSLTTSRLYLNAENILLGLPEGAPSSFLLGEAHPMSSGGSYSYNTYSFSLYPEQPAPSGSCNLSQVDQVALEVVLRGRPGSRSAMVVFARSYNVLRISGGVGYMLFQHN